MPHHYARLIVVAVAAVSFSTPITAQQEPTSPPTVETLVETLGGRVRQNEQREVDVVYLTGTQITDAGLAHLTGLTALETLGLTARAITDTGLAHLTELPALEHHYLEDDRWHSNFVGESKLQQALPNCTISPPRPTRAVLI